MSFLMWKVLFEQSRVLHIGDCFFYQKCLESFLYNVSYINRALWHTYRLCKFEFGLCQLCDFNKLHPAGVFAGFRVYLGIFPAGWTCEQLSTVKLPVVSVSFFVSVLSILFSMVWVVVLSWIFWQRRISSLTVLLWWRSVLILLALAHDRH